jgi:hypothetical protein
MEHAESDWQFEGFTSPNFTSVPDEFFDVLAPRLSGGEVKVLLYIIRRTYGFKKESDTISISQMLNGIVKRNGERLDHGAGLSKPSLCRALNSLADKHVIIAKRQFDRNGSNMATSYQLNVRGDGPESSGLDGQKTLGKKMRQGGLSRNLPKGLSQNLTKPLVKKRDIQYTVNNRQLDNNVNVTKKGKNDKNYLHLLPDAHLDAAHIELIASDILETLGDKQSAGFYHLVARKVPEEVIRTMLSEVKQSGARSKAKVFTCKVMRYAEEQVEREFDDMSAAALKEERRVLVRRLTYE